MVLFSILIYTYTVIAVSFRLYKNAGLRIPIVLFISISLIGQVMAYGFNIGSLKIFISNNNGHGVTYNFIVGTILPLIFAFTTYSIDKAFKNVTRRKL